jgi:hypothetical protein
MNTDDRKRMHEVLQYAERHLVFLMENYRADGNDDEDKALSWASCWTARNANSTSTRGKDTQA